MPTKGEKLKVRRLVAAGRSYEQIAAEMPGWTPRQCRALAIRERYVKPQSRADRPTRSKPTIRTNGEFGIHAAGLRMDYIGAQPKPDTLEERERAYSAPRSITAIVMGDPPAGRSALDKRMAGAR